MKTQKKVFNKLFKEEKTELSAQKIELKNLNVLKSRRKIFNCLGANRQIQ